MAQAFKDPRRQRRFEFRGHEAPMDIDNYSANTANASINAFSKSIFAAFESTAAPTEMEIDTMPAVESSVEYNHITSTGEAVANSNPKDTVEPTMGSQLLNRQSTKAWNGKSIHANSSGNNNSHNSNNIRQKISRWDLRTWMHLPAVIYQWAHLIYNILVLSIIGYLLLQTMRTLYADYQIKFQHFQQEIIAENEQCGRQYRENRCFPDTRVPAIAQQCIEWEKCMQRDPELIAGTKVSASVVAEIFESFASSLSYKTMLFLVLLVVMSVFIKWILGGIVGQLSAISNGSGGSNNQSLHPIPCSPHTIRRSMIVDGERYQSIAPFRRQNHEFGKLSMSLRRSRSLTPSRTMYRATKSAPYGSHRNNSVAAFQYIGDGDDDIDHDIDDGYEDEGEISDLT